MIAIGALLLAAAAAVTVVLTQSGGHTASAAGAGVPAGFTTASVERRTLSEHSTVDGTLGFAGTAEVYDRIGGTFTWLPAVGAVVSRGGALFRVDNLPIALMYGSVPAYRALEQGVADGPDVQELNANLVALGYDPDRAITVNEHFSEATAAAVKRWQHAEGLAETGAVELGRIVFAPGARRVTAVHVVVGQDPPGGESEASDPSGSGSPSGSSSPSGSGQPSGSSEPGSGKSPSNGSKHSPSKSDEGEGAGKGSRSPGNDGSGSGDKEKEHSGSGSQGKGNSGSGSGDKEKEHSGSGSQGKGNSGSEEKEASGNGNGGGGGAPELVLSTTADTQIVTLQLKATQQELAHIGEAVPVALPDGTTVHGHVSEVGTVATESSGEGGSGKGGAGSGSGGSGAGNEGGNGENATVSVKVTLDHPIAHLDKAPVSVELIKAVRHNVLAVPATALLATGGGGFAVQSLERNRRVEIPVTPGMFANGYVEVEGSGLSEGMTALEPQ